MADVIADNAKYNGEGFTVDKQYANSDLSVILGKAGQPFTLDAQKDKERILAACDKLSQFVKQKYGSNIILCKVSLNDKVRDYDGKIKPLVTDKKKFANAKARFEADFYSATAEYVDYIVQYSPVQKYFDKL